MLAMVPPYERQEIPSGLVRLVSANCFSPALVSVLVVGSPSASAGSPAGGSKSMTLTDPRSGMGQTDMVRGFPPQMGSLSLFHR